MIGIPRIEGHVASDGATNLSHRVASYRSIFAKTAGRTASVCGLLIAAASALAPAVASADPVDLSGWTREGTGGNWTLGSGNNSVTQSVNGTPTVFYSDYNAFGNKLSGTIRVNTSSDDDFIGFVVGFNPGDLTGPATDFILIDWKQIDQNFRGFASKGLAVSRVTKGLADNAGAWSHDFATFGVQELARGATLGSTGWVDLTTYTFDIQYTPTNLKVFVDSVLQADLNGTFSDGRFGFYNYSQANVQYAGITNTVLPPPPPPPPPPLGAVPEPATWAMMILGFGVVGGAMRRRPRVTVAIARA